ncbi:MAG: acyl-CoA dehydrogenase family protein [Oscillospiraceae bacterium]|nr:acyl-CoA dehydrogenase family protein [Oscillospiraceae bacterium]
MYQITEEQRMLRKKLREFVDREVLPMAQSYEQSRAFPRALFSQLGDLGYLDMNYFNRRPDARYEGIDSAIILEELARGLPSMALSMSPHVQCMNLIALEGTESLRSRVVPAALRGEHVLAFAITEASGGSDALGIDTTAAFDGDGWILNGEKCWITSAGSADGYVVSAKSATSGRYRDVSLFYVDANTPGLDASFRAELIGMRNSPTGSVRMRNCKVPIDCLIGHENSAYGQMKVLLNEGRFDMAALAVGIAQGALENTVRHTSRSGHFGRTLATYQGVSFQVARMYEKIFVARNSLYTVAEMFRDQQRATMEVAALKLFASEMCVEVCRTAVQLHGAKGLSQYTDADRYFRDAQMLTIGEGSSEVCQIVISGKLYHTDLENY